ncbi:RimK/LysX family protein [Ruegeria sp. HKCCA0235A]|uniref:ATP-dependent zinc protease family protein n=1 Tax=Ruegeria sp. HKCCA0235A TaxID=2682998 RepID=UPI001489B367|nr:RimK/LysX family protein [Ruegeria sp. HKCCA0235A]
MTKHSKKPEVIGWRERISLPEFGIEHIPAKIDTGARTAALHAVDQTVFKVDGERWVEFMIPVQNRRSANRVRTRVVDEREIKNTGGVPERRLIVRTQLLLGQHRWHIDVSLANRAKMEFDLILGRTAIRRRGILVDPGHSYLLGVRETPTRIKSDTTLKGIKGQRE